MEKRSFPFEKLIAWQKAKQIALDCYNLTESFPDHESYGSKSQVRRAAVSISANIAEGTSKSSNKEKCRFITIAYSSMMELFSHCTIARDLNYISEEQLDTMRENIQELSKILSGLKRSYLI